MSPARPGPRPQISTHALLQAVATRGRRWPAAFADQQIISVNEALERELLNGNLTDAHTLSAAGEQALAQTVGHPARQGRFDLRIDHSCRRHDPCWTITCVRCATTGFAHVGEDELEQRVQQAIADHTCPGGPAS